MEAACPPHALERRPTCLASRVACTVHAALKLRGNTVQFLYFGHFSLVLTPIRPIFFPRCLSFIPLEEYQVRLNLLAVFFTIMA